MKRICIYCEKWASGGIESFLTAMLSKLDFGSSGFQIDIVTSRMEESIFTAPLQRLGISFHQLSGDRNCIFQNRKEFIKLLEHKHYDVLHVNAFHAASLYYLCLGRKYGIPMRIAHSHNSDLRQGKFRWLKLAVHNWGKRHFVQEATDLWACSSAAAQFMFSTDQGVRIIPNGIDTTRFRFRPDQRTAVKKRLHIDDQIVIGHVGRLSYQKNQIFLLSVFQRFIQHMPNSRLMLVGDGELEGRLKEQAEALGLADRVLFVGATERVEELLWAMDVFWFPSLFEGLGIAAVEAQAAGLPVLCSTNVPQEALLLPAAQALPLDGGEDAWVTKTLALCERTVRREDCAELVRAKGYDMRDVAHLIAALYQAGHTARGKV